MVKKVRVGDYFGIPVSDDLFALACIFHNYHDELGITVFSSLFREQCGAEVLSDAGDKLLGGMTLDAKLFHGDWPIQFHDVESAIKIERPLYLINVDGVPHVEVVDHQIIRPAEPMDTENLVYRKVISPIRYQKAIQALNGFGDWLPHYEEMRFEYFKLSCSRV